MRVRLSAPKQGLLWVFVVASAACNNANFLGDSGSQDGGRRQNETTAQHKSSGNSTGKTDGTGTGTGNKPTIGNSDSNGGGGIVTDNSQLGKPSNISTDGGEQTVHLATPAPTPPQMSDLTITMSGEDRVPSLIFRRSDQSTPITVPFAIGTTTYPKFCYANGPTTISVTAMQEDGRAETPNNCAVVRQLGVTSATLDAVGDSNCDHTDHNSQFTFTCQTTNLQLTP